MSEFLTINTEKNIIQNVVVEPLSVFTEGHPALSIRVSEFTDSLPDTSISNIIERMKVTLKHYNGLGLSANQCGLSLRLFVIGIEGFIITCINPKIINQTGEIKDKEGCLSYPGLFLNKNRADNIEVEYLTENGELKKVEFSGLTARIFQHELDHLDGVQFTDNIGNTAMLFAREKQKKLIKKFSRIVKKNYGRK